MNRLGREKSPYLLQHKDNPVWWYPWGEEAFAAARKSQRPIFLSVGYSTCHWCHVMERESFENPQVAEVLNGKFIAIKVDREERPDVDDIYMSAVQHFSGRGGWPMSVWLTPDGAPFFGGTYFPPPQFIEILNRISEIWRDKAPQVLSDSQRVTALLRHQSEQMFLSTKDLNLEGILNKMAHVEGETYDPDFGGFSNAPKFPQTLNLMALMRMSRRSSVKATREVLDSWVRRTLQHMHRGGMFDHLAGGFHRYSTDREWIVPHFEKMLYDNALLAMTYTEAFQYYDDPEYALVAKRTLDYILREMTDKGGGFYSAQDADSLNPQTQLKEEGFFCTFEPDEIKTALTEEEYSLMKRWFSLSERGHYEGRIILHYPKLYPVESVPLLNHALDKLREIRATRVPPHLDDKVLVAWNGLMIASLAKASIVFSEEKYLLAAQRAATFLLKNCLKDDLLLRRWRDGESRFNAYSEDYACLIHGLLNLYEADQNEEWLLRAEKLQNILDAKFWDSGSGGYFRDDGADPLLIVRMKDDYDGVTPTANSLSILNLQKLFHYFLKTEYMDRVQKIIKAFQARLETLPVSLPQMIIGIDMLVDDVKEIVVAPAEGAKDSKNHLLRLLRQGFYPNQVIAVAQGETKIPLAQGKQSQEKSLVYICKLGQCDLPHSSDDKIREAMRDVKPLTIHLSH